jgi:hypothetical protein
LYIKGYYVSYNRERMQKDESGAAKDVKNTSEPKTKGNSSALNNNVSIFGPVALNQVVDDSSGGGH